MELTTNSIGLKFYFWAQEYRIKRYGGEAGVPDSIRKNKIPKISQDVASMIKGFQDKFT